MDSNGHGTKTNYDVINQNIPDTNETYDSFTIGSVFYWPENFNEWKEITLKEKNHRTMHTYLHINNQMTFRNR